MRTEKFPDSRGRNQTWHRGGLVGVNRCLGRLRAFYSWAVKGDYVTATPFKKGTETIVEMFSEAKRERRLQPAHGEQQGEQERIFNAANPHLQALIVAALETACRVGELLSLQWRQVRWDLNEIHLPAKKTKQVRRRELPMSRALQAMLQMRRHDPEGREYPLSLRVRQRHRRARQERQNRVGESGSEGTRHRTEAGKKRPPDRGVSASACRDRSELSRSAAGVGGTFPGTRHGAALREAFRKITEPQHHEPVLNITSQGMHSALKRVEIKNC